VSLSGPSTRRIDGLRDVMASYVENGTVPGLVALLASHDEVHLGAIGALGFGRPSSS
jgi:hypothetical protein